RMNNLVSSHSEGVAQHANNLTTDIIERGFAYKYQNGRTSVAGHGWLGFDRRTVIETVDPGVGVQYPAFPNQVVRITTTEYDPPSRYTPDGQPGAGTTPPYMYPLAGLPRSTTVDESASVNGVTPPLESAPHRRRTVVRNDWGVQVSAAGRPFPAVRNRFTATYERPVPSFPPPSPDTSDGTRLSQCQETFRTDNYGNVESHGRGCDDEFTQTTTSFSNNPTTWLISNPTRITGRSEEFVSTKTRVRVMGYDARGLLTTVEEQPDGPPAEFKSTAYDRDEFGNVRRIIEEVF